MLHICIVCSPEQRSACQASYCLALRAKQLRKNLHTKKTAGHRENPISGSLQPVINNTILFSHLNYAGSIK